MCLEWIRILIKEKKLGPNVFIYQTFYQNTIFDEYLKYLFIHLFIYSKDFYMDYMTFKELKCVKKRLNRNRYICLLLKIIVLIFTLQFFSYIDSLTFYLIKTFSTQLAKYLTKNLLSYLVVYV